MIDCVLVYPIPSQDSPAKGVALSIFYVGAMLEKQGFNVEYVDERFDSPQRIIELAKANPVCVGVSAMTGVQLLEAKRILTLVKAINPKIHTVLGGVHPSLLPLQSIVEDCIDIVCVRDGEYTMLDLMRALKSNRGLESVDGIVWKKDGEIIQNKDRSLANLDDLPCPLTSKTKRYYQIAAKAGQVRILSSRGCPHNCTFCFNQVYNLRHWRPMSVKKFEEELNILTRELEIKFLILGDDNIGKDMTRIEGICKLLRDRGISWHTMTRCDYMTKDLTQTLDSGGCKSVIVGVESGSDRILNEVINKQYINGVDDVRTCVRNVAESNISGMYSFMCGIPSETRQELKMSMSLVDWIKKTDSKSRLGFYVYAPYPGTPLYEQAVRDGFKEPTTIEGWSTLTLGDKMSGNRQPDMENLYYIAGLTFRKDKTAQNFPDWRRALIKPFELTASWRWRTRFISHYIEKPLVKSLIGRASSRLRLSEEVDETDNNIL